MTSKASNGHKGPIDRPIPTADVGLHYMNCRICTIEAKERGEPIREYSKLSVAFTTVGLQVFCTRHEVNVIHIDFEGARHPANNEAK